MRLFAEITATGHLARTIAGGFYRRWAASADRGTRLAVLAALFLAVAGFFLMRMLFVLAHPATADCILGSDTIYYSAILDGDGWHGLRAAFLAQPMFDKHPAVVAVALVLMAPLYLAGLPTPIAAAVAFAVMVGTGACLLFVFLVRNGCSKASALAGTLLVLLCFSPLSVLSALDTAGVIFAGMAFGLLVASECARHAERQPLPAAILAGLAGGVAASTVVPAAVVVLMFAGAAWHRVAAPIPRRAVLLIVLPSLVAVAIAIAPGLAVDLVHRYFLQANWAQRWSSISHFTEARLALRYPASFFAFAVVSPHDFVKNIYTAADLPPLLAQGWRLLALVCFWAAVAVGAYRLGRSKPRILAALATMVAALFVFYLYYDPWENILFALQWCVPLAVIAALGLGRSRTGAAGLFAVAILLGAVNLGVLYGDVAANVGPRCPYSKADGYAGHFIPVKGLPPGRNP